MTTDVYRQMQQRLDTFSVGFPATESGVELEILRRLYKPEDAALFLALSQRLEEPAAVAERVGRPAEEVAAHLEDMAGRGLCFRLKKGDLVRYGAIPFVHGIYEFQVKRLNRELAELMDRYTREGFEDAMAISAEAFLRIIPVQRSVPTTRQVAAFDDAAEILKNQRLIVLTDCICRKQKASLDQGCGKPIDNCFMFGSMAQYYLDHDMGRQVDLDEALATLAAAREAGLVTQPATTQNPGGMCNCCGDCCGVLSSLKALPNPAQEVFTNHYAMVNADECVGCGECLDRCQMAAIVLEDDLARVLPERCIGCGLCVTSCPTEALELLAKDEPELRVPPATGLDQMKFMAGKRAERRAR